MVDEEFMRVSEAATYLGISAQTLRRWDRDGTLKAVRRPGSDYRFYRRADLEPFRLVYRRAEEAAAADGNTSVFATANADIEANAALRGPQRAAHRAVREHFAADAGPAIVQIPVGCGKTGVMATLPFGIAKGRVLVITPNLTIRKGVADAVDITSPQCFWTKCRVISDFTAGPWMAVLDGVNANIHDAIESDFVVCNIQQLASQADRWLPQFPEDFFDMILVDEGHHAAAESWQKVFRRFPNAKVVSLTATPFRSDQQQLHGEIVYRYPFTRAMINGYIKQIHSRNVAPSELYFTYRDDIRRHTLDEVLELREQAWFRRGVALSPECNRHIVEASIQQCDRMRAETGIQHQIIAAACSVDHARQVASIYTECGYRAAEIHSDMADDDQDAVIERLRQGQLDCIVQVQMLGEGFDHPRLSVAAIFRPFRSLAPYVQFVGRVMRVVQESAPDHPDNQGHIVSHVGLNNDARWTEFRELDLDDQALIRTWVDGNTDDDPKGRESEPRPRRFDEGMLVDNEILTSFVEHTYLDPTDDRVLDELLSREIAPGITVGDLVGREQLRERLLAKQVAAPVPASIPVSPQRQRQSTKTRVNERAKSVANRVLTELKLPHRGHQLMAVTPGQRQYNSAIVIRRINTAINHVAGEAKASRGQWTLEQMTTIFERLDEIGDSVRDALRDQLSKKK
ncbi:DEAD/DEAH box helicase [Antrihabitans sp. YC2-6]|uniref:DEAD/DEAH box helicase n=1 Tax=Antrihabitans sp. YC2-6 TaxID=2799498 RepID=UPI0018F3F125|nr:DEAD/DEAH box helicase family protein [Antrihabitans sp. YC2-6]MBJ8344490.1 DEAD/DEAH box helicase family protein [Antrihabitans sp. YC2-6]